MKKEIETNENGKQEIEIPHITCKQEGYGHWIIEFEIEFKGKKKYFYHTTTNSMMIDALSDLKQTDATHEKIQETMWNFWSYYVEERIAEAIDWIIFKKSN